MRKNDWKKGVKSNEREKRHILKRNCKVLQLNLV